MTSYATTNLINAGAGPRYAELNHSEQPNEADPSYGIPEFSRKK